MPDSFLQFVLRDTEWDPFRTILTVMFAIILFVVTSPNYVSGASAIEVK